MSISNLRERFQKSFNRQKEISDNSNGFGTPKENKMKDLYPPEKYWSYTLGDDNTARCMLRILPPPDGDDALYVQDIWYNWTNPKNERQYNAKCRDVLGLRDDPMTNWKNSVWAKSKSEGEKLGVRKQYRYVVNVYIINDENNPENNGKVRLWNMPRAVWKIMDEANGTIPMDEDFGSTNDAKPINIWSPFEDGVNLILKVGKKGIYTNYDNTKVGRQRPLFENDEDDVELERVFSMRHSLKDVNKESTFETVEALTRKLNYALGSDDSGYVPKAMRNSDEDDEFETRNTFSQKEHNNGFEDVPDFDIREMNDSLDDGFSSVSKQKSYSLDVDDDLDLNIEELKNRVRR